MEKCVVIDITKYKTVHDDVTIFFEQRWTLPFRRLLGISVVLSLYIIWIFVVISRKDFCETLQKLSNIATHSAYATDSYTQQNKEFLGNST